MSGKTVKKSIESKRADSTNLSLREELQFLYRSLQSKNNELIEMEKKVVDRDNLIADLRRKNPTANQKDKLFAKKIEKERQQKSSDLSSERSDSSSSRSTSSASNEYSEAIKELNDKIIRQSCHLSYLQRTLESKERSIIELQNSIDKFRQIMRPITQRMLVKRDKCDCMNELNDCFSGIGDWSPGVESTRVLPVSEPRIKRQAISAEPLSQMVKLGDEDGLIRIPKSSL